MSVPIIGQPSQIPLQITANNDGPIVFVQSAFGPVVMNVPLPLEVAVEFRGHLDAAIQRAAAVQAASSGNGSITLRMKGR